MQNQTQTKSKPAPTNYPVALILEPKDAGYIFILANYGYPGCVRIKHSIDDPGIFAAAMSGVIGLVLSCFL